MNLRVSPRHIIDKLLLSLHVSNLRIHEVESQKLKERRRKKLMMMMTTMTIEEEGIKHRTYIDTSKF